MCIRDRSQLEHIVFSPCEILLALPVSHPFAKMAAPENLPYHTLDLELLKNDSFVLMSKATRIRTIADYHFMKMCIRDSRYCDHGPSGY